MTDPYEGPACVVPGCTRPAAPGWQVCASDGRWVGDTLARIGDRYTALNPAKTLAAPTDTDGGHGGTLASQRDPARLHVLVITDRRSRQRDDSEGVDPDGNDLGSVFEILHAHAVVVRDERKIRLPRLTSTLPLGRRPPGPLCDHWCAHDSCRRWTLRGTTPAPLSVATERAVLAAQLDWILGQDWADQFHADLTAVWSLLGGGPRRTGHACPDCGAELGTVRGAAVCTGCRRRWEGLALIELNTGRTA